MAVGLCLCGLPLTSVRVCALTLLYRLQADTHLLGGDGNGREPQLLSFSFKEKVERSGNAVLRQS